MKFNLKVLWLIIGTLILTLLSLIVLKESGYYDYLQHPYFKSRSLGSVRELWLNGYLGLIFRNINFGFATLLFPLVFLYYFITFFSRNSYQKTLIIIFTLAFAVIGVRGYQNFRYALTLFPLAIITTLYAVHEVSNINLKWRSILFSLLLIIPSISIYKLRKYYKYYWKQVTHSQPQNARTRMVNYIVKNIPENEVLIVNQIEYYYYTQRKSLMYSIQKKDQTSAQELLKLLIEKKIKYVAFDQRGVNLVMRFKPIAQVIQKYGEVIHSEGRVKLARLNIY